MSSKTLRTVIFLGSARDIIPPWGGDKRLGDRIAKWVTSTLDARSGKLGDDTVITHSYTVVDPLEVFGPGGALTGFTGAEMRAPTFFMKNDDLPAKTKQLMETIREADSFLIISSEYNHTAPPALTSVMGHFGGSLYKCKPSGIVTYSPGPWGGVRAAKSIVGMTHELGCISVSKICAIPTVSDLFDEQGIPKDANHRMLKQLPEMLDQLEWMAVAMKNQRESSGAF